MLSNLNTTCQDGHHCPPQKASAPDYKVLQRLRQSCRVTLERYIDVASHTAGQLAMLTPGSFDSLQRANLALLKQKESRAHEAYLKSRAALLDYVLAEDEADSGS